MKTFVRNFAIISLVFVCSHLSILAEGPAPLGDSSQLPFYSVENKLGVRIGIGFAKSYLNLDTNETGYIASSTDGAEVLRDKLDSPAGISTSVGAKYSLKNYFSVGLNLDYNALKVKNMRFRAGDFAANWVDIDGEDFGYLHLFSMYAFVEFRLPLPNFGPGYVLGAVAPYIQAGIGGTYIMPDMGSGVTVNSNPASPRRDGDKIFDLNEQILFGLMLAGGLEFFLEDNSNISFFFEGRYHYNLQGNYDLKPISTSKFEGDFDISNFSWYMGVNLYFGGVEQKS